MSPYREFDGVVIYVSTHREARLARRLVRNGSRVRAQRHGTHGTEPKPFWPKRKRSRK